MKIPITRSARGSKVGNLAAIFESSNSRWSAYALLKLVINEPKNSISNDGKNVSEEKRSGSKTKNSTNLSHIPSKYAPNALARFFARASAPSNMSIAKDINIKNKPNTFCSRI